MLPEPSERSRTLASALVLSATSVSTGFDGFRGEQSWARAGEACQTTADTQTDSRNGPVGLSLLQRKEEAGAASDTVIGFTSCSGGGRPTCGAPGRSGSPRRGRPGG